MSGTHGYARVRCGACRGTHMPRAISLDGVGSPRDLARARARRAGSGSSAMVTQHRTSGGWGARAGASPNRWMRETGRRTRHTRRRLLDRLGRSNLECPRATFQSASGGPHDTTTKSPRPRLARVVRRPASCLSADVCRLLFVEAPPTPSPPLTPRFADPTLTMESALSHPDRLLGAYIRVIPGNSPLHLYVVY